MTNKTEMVSVPRALAQRFSDYAHLVGIPASSPQLAELREKLAAPADDVRAVGDEPVADVVLFNGEKIIDGTLAYMATAQIGDRLYRRPQNKVVMPDRLIFSSCPTQQPYVVGWNACLDELSRLNPQ